MHFASRFFCTFLSRCGHNCDMKISDFTCPLYGVRKQNTNFFSFSFSKLRYGPFEFSPRKFHQYLTHQRVTKFETVRVHFLSDVFGLLSSRNFATMATWRTTSLYLKAFYGTEFSKTICLSFDAETNRFAISDKFSLSLWTLRIIPWFNISFLWDLVTCKYACHCFRLPRQCWTERNQFKVGILLLKFSNTV